MNINSREPVLLAVDHAALVDWYVDTLGFEIVKQFSDAFHYANLQTSTGVKLGIGDAAEMGVEPQDRSRNTLILQLEVEDVRAFLEHVKNSGGSITAEAAFDKNDNFWFGGFADPEGNPWWVVEPNCP